MFFSILVPVYNTSEYLHECVDSILCQSFRDFELVLINDGSTDSSGAMCDEFAALDPRVRVIHKENEGLMMTRRRGFREAKGDYFICVDSDDKLWDNCALEKLHDMIASTGCDMVIYNYVYGAGGGRSEHPSHLLEHETGHVFEGDTKTELYEKMLTTSTLNNMWLKCMARHVVDVDVDYGQWKAQICRAEDRFQTYPMLTNAKRIAYISQPLYYYRWTPGSIGNKPKLKYCNAYKCMYTRENDYLQQWPVSAETREKAIRRRVTAYMDVLCSGYWGCKQGGTVLDWKKFVSALADDPFFRGIMDSCRKEKVLKYYRILHTLICRKRCGAAIFVIEATAAISAWKHGRKKNA